MRKLTFKDLRALTATAILYAGYCLLTSCGGGQTGVASSSLSSVLPTPTPTPTATPIGSTPTPTPTATPNTVPTPQPTPTPTPTSTVSEYFTVSAVFPSPIYAPTHLSTDWTKACAVDVNQLNAGSKDIICYAEVGNLDLYDTGFSISIGTPALGCAYLQETPYWFMQWQAGAQLGSGDLNNAPTAISYTLTASGTIDSTTLVSSPAGYAKLSSAIPPALECNWDHTQENPVGPNCCQGPATVTATTSSGTVSKSIVTYAGLEGNCANGPGSSSTLGVERDGLTGLPKPILYSAYAGLSLTRDIVSPVSLGYSSDLYSSDYSASTTPDAVSVYGSQYYTYECLDPSFAVLGRIHMMVRKWNLESQLLLGAGGNNETTGMVNGIPAPQSEPYDWDEFTTKLGNSIHTYPTDSL